MAKQYRLYLQTRVACPEKSKIRGAIPDLRAGQLNITDLRSIVRDGRMRPRLDAIALFRWSAIAF